MRLLVRRAGPWTKARPTDYAHRSESRAVIGRISNYLPPSRMRSRNLQFIKDLRSPPVVLTSAPALGPCYQMDGASIDTMHPKRSLNKQALQNCSRRDLAKRGTFLLLSALRSAA